MPPMSTWERKASFVRVPFGAVMSTASWEGCLSLVASGEYAFAVFLSFIEVDLTPCLISF